MKICMLFECLVYITTLVLEKQLELFLYQIYFEMVKKYIKNRLGPILFYIGNAC